MNNSINNTPHIEIANHGWDHEDFTQYGKDKQSQLMYHTNQKISDVLGVSPEVFIAPMSLFNNDTLQAAQSNGIHYFSASSSTDSPPYNHNNITPLYHFPATAATSDLTNNSNVWFSYSLQEIFNEILYILDNYGFAVVVVQPQNYSIREGKDMVNKVDWQQINALNLLIDQIRDEELKIVTIGEINHNMS
jgi:peptidoglycan/xylan/chitin deacetylase (PgdA/CDA1 family)